MTQQLPYFKSALDHLFDFSDTSAADIFNNHIAPAVNALAGDAGLEEAAQRREAQLQQDLSREAFAAEQDTNFFQEQRRSRAAEPLPDFNTPLPTAAPGTPAQPRDVVPQKDQPKPTGDFAKSKIKLSNYGYDSDSSPDYNSNVLKIGNHNNKLEDGVSAALTRSLAKRHGISVGDMFEVQLSDGSTIKRRYDDTVPTKYRGRALPETVDLYEINGNNNFSGVVTGIRTLK